MNECFLFQEQVHNTETDRLKYGVQGNEPTKYSSINLPHS